MENRIERNFQAGKMERMQRKHRNHRIMRGRFVLTGVVAGVLLVVGALIASPPEDPIFRALEDEME